MAHGVLGQGSRKRLRAIQVPARKRRVGHARRAGSRLHLSKAAQTFDYFAAQIFAKVPRITQEFLVATAYLPQVPVSIARELTGNAEAETILEDLYRRHLFTHRRAGSEPVYWYHAPSPLKLMIDRLVCADGGNADPTSTSGKNAEKAKSIELDGWPYPKHLEGRAYGLVVHGDVAGIEGLRRSLSDWLDWMGLIDAGFGSRLDRMIGYYEPYATSHDALDKDVAIQQEVRDAAKALIRAVGLSRAGQFPRLETEPDLRPK